MDRMDGLWYFPSANVFSAEGRFGKASFATDDWVRFVLLRNLPRSCHLYGQDVGDLDTNWDFKSHKTAGGIFS